jgi:hypothetical protein
MRNLETRKHWQTDEPRGALDLRSDDNRAEQPDPSFDPELHAWCDDTNAKKAALS